MEHFIKDLGIALSESKRMGLSLPGLALAHQLYLAVAAQGESRPYPLYRYLAVAARVAWGGVEERDRRLCSSQRASVHLPALPGSPLPRFLAYPTSAIDCRPRQDGHARAVPRPRDAQRHQAVAGGAARLLRHSWPMYA